MKDRQFDTVTQLITQSKQIDVYPDCNAISFTNIGDTQVKVDEVVLNPSTTPATVLGDSYTVAGHQNEVYNKKSVQVIFVQPVGANPVLQVIQKFYVA